MSIYCLTSGCFSGIAFACYLRYFGALTPLTLALFGLERQSRLENTYVSEPLSQKASSAPVVEGMLRRMGLSGSFLVVFWSPLVSGTDFLALAQIYYLHFRKDKDALENMKNR